MQELQGGSTGEVFRADGATLTLVIRCSNSAKLLNSDAKPRHF